MSYLIPSIYTKDSESFETIVLNIWYRNSNELIHFLQKGLY